MVATAAMEIPFGTEFAVGSNLMVAAVAAVAVVAVDVTEAVTAAMEHRLTRASALRCITFQRLAREGWVSNPIRVTRRFLLIMG
jgi:hypothetical protein